MTPLEKQEKSARHSLARILNHVRIDFSMKRIATLHDYLVKGLGYDDKHIREVLHYRDDELHKKLAWPEVKDLLEDFRLGFEAEWYLRKNPPDVSDLAILNTPIRDLQSVVVLDLERTSDDKDKDYGLPPSDKEKCKLFWFQKKHTKQLLDGILIHKLRGQLLIAAAGHGKTFIFGALLRRLLDIEFHKGKTVSPWPYCVITKASVVEQTKRVLRNSFGIDTNYECFVTNYDQMRANFGEIFVQEKTIVTNGQEEIVWQWRPMIHPCVFIIDESQAAKNGQSTQSKIICSISEIDSPHVYCVFSSATPGTRVSEMEYLVLNCRIDVKLW